MSTRLYPLYQRGNPQLRVFLPNFWMKCIKPDFTAPPNVVHFICSIEMTSIDVKNYLEKIYNVHAVTVRTHIRMGACKKNLAGYIVKEEDDKYAYVTLDEDVKFEFPDLFPKKTTEKTANERQFKEIEKMANKFRNMNWDRAGVPGWHGI